MRSILILLLVFLIGVGAWFLLREDGYLEQVTAERVEQALLDNGMPANMAECMGPRLVDRLSLAQLRKLERIAPEEGESAIPTTSDEAMTRLRRVDDPEAVEQMFLTAGGCGFELITRAL